MDAPAGKAVEGSFHIEQEVEIAAPRERVWTSMLDVQGWWGHCFGARETRLRLEAFPGGRFYEDSPDSQALFGVVTYIKAPEVLRLNGPLGMSRLPVTSVYEWKLEERGKGTTLLLMHRAVGLLDPAWHEAHEKGWRELWVHLKALAERGTRLRA